MSDRGTLHDALKGAKKIKITYEENGKRRQKTGSREEILKLLEKINRTPGMCWSVIKKLY